MYDEVNKKLEETVNATVEVEFLSWAEHDTKYSLLFSSGEDFDLIFTATGWAHYSETANMGGFYELTPEFISTYAPDIQAVDRKMPGNRPKSTEKFIWSPCYKNEYASGGNLLVRGDLMEKYGYEDITSREELEAFLDDVCTGEASVSALERAAENFRICTNG